MNILHVVPSLNRGGTERQMFNLAFEQKKQGHHVSIICLYHINHFEELSCQFDVYFINTKIQLSIFKKSIIELSEYTDLLGKLQPDALHSHSYPSDRVVLSSIRNGIQYFCHHHVYHHILANWSFKYLRSKKLLSQFIDKWLLIYQYYKASAHIICVSKAHHAFLKSKLPFFLHGKIHLIHNSVDATIFAIRPPNPPSSVIRLISVGSLYPLKNHLFQLQFMEKLKEIFPDCMLHIYGNGHYQNVIEEKIKEMNLENNVILKGSTTELSEILCDYDIFIHTSNEETFGLAILEGMCAGLPILCHNAGGNRDLVINGENGYIINNFNVDEYIESVQLILKNYSQMSAESVFISQTFSNSKHFEAISKLMNSN
jgi:glycosyltransferase involved in cell wall biosynthesis